ncbi:hypothetical protein FPV67DRAFT_1474298 [Lyophyllum atratum]|nr:hypothetical protein FPV67DRAFT_1474298 [Lyophyllum atratum]
MPLFGSNALSILLILMSTMMPTTWANPAVTQPTTISGNNGTVKANGALAIGGFAQSCSSWGGTYGNTGGRGIAIIQATCRTTTGASKTTTINLDQCYGNDNGNMNCRSGGGFGGSCSVDNSLSTGNTILAVTCKNTSGGSVQSQVDVNTCVGNLDGTLAC